MSLYEIFPDKSCEIIDLKLPSTINLPNFNNGKLDNRPFEWRGYDYYITLIFKLYSKFYF